MLGATHELVVDLAMACLDTAERMILYPRWGGIETGATLSDHFKIMWEVEEAGSDTKQLVHRCYVDSKNSKNHGCITRTWNHASGCLGFIDSYMKGDLEGSYDEVSFLENLGMFMGIVSHHIADLCTPVHVGSKIDFKSLGYASLARLHSQVERDIQRMSMGKIMLEKPRLVSLSEDYFWDIARDTYSKHFSSLPKLYKHRKEEGVRKMVSAVVSSAVAHTASVWHTILTESDMVRQEWSRQPLI